MRRVIMAAGALIALAATAALTVWSVVGLLAQAWAPGQASFDTLLGLVAGVGAAGCGAWLAAGAMLTVLGSLPGALAAIADAVAQRIAPQAWRRLIHLTLGVALVSGPVGAAAPAWAGYQQPSVHAELDSGQPSLDPEDPAALPPIDRPVDTGLVQTSWTPSAPPTPIAITPPASPVVTGHPRATATVEDHVVVRRGDTLWHIAARFLANDSSEASAAEVAIEWPRWWTANRDVIGPDPDLILPGQVLRPPT